MRSRVVFGYCITNVTAKKRKRMNEREKLNTKGPEVSKAKDLSMNELNIFALRFGLEFFVPIERIRRNSELF